MQVVRILMAISHLQEESHDNQVLITGLYVSPNALLLQSNVETSPQPVVTYPFPAMVITPAVFSGLESVL